MSEKRFSDDLVQRILDANAALHPLEASPSTALAVAGLAREVQSWRAANEDGRYEARTHDAPA